MKIRLIALAALAAAGSAHALTPAQIASYRAAGTLKEIYLAGGSAQRLFIGAWFQQQCKAATFDVFFDGTGATPAGSSYRAYSCDLSKKVGNFVAGTHVLLVKRDTGGSFQGVNPIASATTQEFLNVDASCTATGKPSPATDIQSPGYACVAPAAGTNLRLADAGVSDVEPALFQKPVNLPSPQTAITITASNMNSAPFNQTIMGVIVNKKAYRALQEAQGLIAAGGAIDESAAAQPSLTRSFVSSAFSGKLSGSTTAKLGWNVVIPATVDSAVLSKQVNVCRRNIGSGTQASFNVELLNGGCATGAATYAPVGQVVGTANSTISASPAMAEVGTLAWTAASGAGALETCVGTTVENLAGTAYGIGMLSRENNPRAIVNGVQVDKGYRFVKLDGVAPLRDVAKVGDYKFVYDATMQWNPATLTDADKLAFVTALRVNGGKAASLAGADVDTQEGVMAPPTSYSTAYADITDATTLKFASRMDRNKAASCSPMRIVK